MARGCATSQRNRGVKLGTASHPISELQEVQSELTVKVTAWEMPWKGMNSGWFAYVDSRVAKQKKLPSLQ